MRPSRLLSWSRQRIAVAVLGNLLGRHAESGWLSSSFRIFLRRSLAQIIVLESGHRKNVSHPGKARENFFMGLILLRNEHWAVCEPPTLATTTDIRLAIFS